MGNQDKKKSTLANRVLGRLHSVITVAKGCGSKNDVPEDNVPTERHDRVNKQLENQRSASPEKDARRRPQKRLSSPAIEATGTRRDSKMMIGPRSSSQPVLVKFLPQYVNRLKAQPFSLKEKMTRWCKMSPYALIKKHLPPEDHYLPFPTQPYEDLACDQYGRSFQRLEQEREERSLKPRMEVVLQRYPKGRHGIVSTFDLAPDEDRKVSPNGRVSIPNMSSPTFDENVKARSLNMPPTATITRKEHVVMPNTTEKGGEEEPMSEHGEEDLSVSDDGAEGENKPRRASSPAKKMCPRGITNCSLLPLNYEMAPKRLTLPEITPMREEDLIVEEPVQQLVSA